MFYDVDERLLPMAHAPPIPAPQHIAGCSILRELNPNATYLADRSGRRVVLKRLEDDCLLDGELHPLIHDRLSRVRELAHVGVANLIAVERDGDTAYLVWDYVEGAPLADRATSIDPTRRGVLARDVITAVESLHALGIVHGEIHGHNVIVTPAGRVKLTHVSPLLYNEENVDVEAVAKLLRGMALPVTAAGVASLRQLALELRENNHPEPRFEGQGNDEGHDRRGSLVAAALLAVVAAVISFGVWSWTSRLSDSDAFAPAAPPRTSSNVERQQGAN